MRGKESLTFLGIPIKTRFIRPGEKSRHYRHNNWFGNYVEFAVSTREVDDLSCLGTTAPSRPVKEVFATATFVNLFKAESLELRNIGDSVRVKTTIPGLNRLYRAVK